MSKALEKSKYIMSVGRSSKRLLDTESCKVVMLVAQDLFFKKPCCLSSIKCYVRPRSSSYITRSITLAAIQVREIGR